jgi:hypothetical protein
MPDEADSPSLNSYISAESSRLLREAIMSQPARPARLRYSNTRIDSIEVEVAVDPSPSLLRNVCRTDLGQELTDAELWMFKHIIPVAVHDEAPPQEWYGYIVTQELGVNGVPYIKHWPPANADTPHFIPDYVCAIGRRGLAVKDEQRNKALKGQTVRLCWAGLDIDFDDNECAYYMTDGNPETLSQRVVRLLGDKLMVRLSKSGHGCHCFLRIKDAPEMSYDKARAVARAMVQPYVQLLKDNNIICCVTGLPNLWVWTSNGQQRTLTMPDYDEDATPYLEATPFIWPSTPEAEFGYVKLENFGPKLRGIILTLCKAGILTTPPATRTQVNVARVKKALEGQVDIKTKAKGREGHEHEPNGVLTLTDSELKLLSNSDNNKTILKLVEL